MSIPRKDHAGPHNGAEWECVSLHATSNCSGSGRHLPFKKVMKRKTRGFAVEGVDTGFLVDSNSEHAIWR